MVIKTCLILVVFIRIYGLNGNIMKSDGSNYIQIDSALNPLRNTSYGSIAISNAIKIQFNLIYHDNMKRYSVGSDIFQNIFHLQSTINKNSQKNKKNKYCTQYPSMWLSPYDNSLYFSLLNNKYCLESFSPIISNIIYLISIQYNDRSIYIAINDTVIINESYSIISNDDNNDILNLWISDTSSDPASVTLSNLYIETLSVNNDISPSTVPYIVLFLFVSSSIITNNIHCIY